MKIINLLFIFIGMALAQPPQRVIYVNSAPLGSCTNGAAMQLVISTGVLYSCQAGTWGQINGSAAPPGGALGGASSFNPCTGGLAFGSGSNGVLGCDSAASAVVGLVSVAAFAGMGLNDISVQGTPGALGASGFVYPAPLASSFVVKISASGTPDSFQWQRNGGSFSSSIPITGSSQILIGTLNVSFGATTGHTLNDQWSWTVEPSEIIGGGSDLTNGIFSVRQLNGTPVAGPGMNNGTLDTIVDKSATGSNNTMGCYRISSSPGSDFYLCKHSNNSTGSFELWSDNGLIMSSTDMGVVSFTSLSPSLPVLTDASKNLISLVNYMPFPKSSISAAAPGAGFAALRWVAGTNMGTCKLVSNAGTSATEVTIVDNVGSGC